MASDVYSCEVQQFLRCGSDGFSDSLKGLKSDPSCMSRPSCQARLSSSLRLIRTPALSQRLVVDDSGSASDSAVASTIRDALSAPTLTIAMPLGGALSGSGVVPTTRSRPSKNRKMTR